MKSILYFLVATILLGASAMTLHAEPGKQVAVRPADGTLPYWIYVPAGKAPKEGWPLLIFLHGSGERGSDLDKVKIHGPPKLVEKTKGLQRFIVVSPQCPTRGGNERWWKTDEVIAVLDRVQKEQSVDASRVYLTGLSLGGFASWALLAAHPNRFAAAAPVCGGGKPETVKRFKHVPIWNFHGDKDGAVRVELSRAMIKALKEAGAKDVKYTEYPGVGHNSWDKAYATAELYDWLLSKRLK